jgi:Flp pilus assembly CpaE family ATPase
LRWPDDAPALIRVVAKVAVPPDGAGAAKVLAVAGARGGAGATTVAALLAASVPDSLVIDFDPVGAGQRAFAPEGAGVASLDRALASPVPEVIVRVAEPHAAGRALYRDPGEPVDRDAASVLVLAARRAASLVVADVGRLNSRGEATLRGAAPLVVLADDVASLRAARSFLDAGGEASFVLNRLRRRGLRAAHVERALGQRPVAVLPPDRRLARAPDLGVLPKRIPRALRKVAKA